MVEVKYCPLCLSKYVVGESGICPNCEGKGIQKPITKVEVKKEGKGK